MSKEQGAGDVRKFDFEFERKYLPLLAVMGVTPLTSSITVDGEDLRCRFGPWTSESPLSNITGVSTTGPYRAYRAIGPRGSFEDGGATFGSTTAGGVFIEFRRPVAALDLTQTLKHKNLTITVQDRENFAAFLRDAAGLSPA